MDLTEAEDIKKRWQEYTEELYKKDLHDQDNHDGVITHLEPDMEQQTGSKSRKEYVKALYCHPSYLTYIQSTSCEKPGWMKHKMKSRLLGEISITSDTQMTPPLWQGVKKN